MKKYDVQIYSPNNLNERWYVYLYDGETQKIVKKFYKGINETCDYDERMLKCEAFKCAIEIELKKGWIPKAQKKPLPQPQDFSFKILEAFDFALKTLEKQRAKKTFQDYSCVYRFIRKGIIALGWQNYFIKEFETYHIKLLLDEVKKRQKWSNKRYNKASNVLRAFFSCLKKEFVIKENIVHGLPYLPEEESLPTQLLTAAEQTKIIDYFNKVCPNFNIFLKIIYQCGIRPKEIREIKCGMIDLENMIFILPKEITKTKARKVPISADLKNDLLNFNLLNPENFLFGIKKSRSRKTEKFGGVSNPLIEVISIFSCFVIKSFNIHSNDIIVHRLVF